MNQLLRQREEWNEDKIGLDQTIADYKSQADDLNNLLLERDHEILNRAEELSALRQELAGAYQQTEDRNSKITELEAQLVVMKDKEAELNDALLKTRVALTREKARVEMYRNVAPVSTVTAVSASGNSEATMSSTVNNATIEHPGSEPYQQGRENTEATTEMQPDVQQRDRGSSPYVLQQDIRLFLAAEAEQQQVTDLDDEDAPLPSMRSVVPSVTRQAEMQAITAGLEQIEAARTDIGIKHMVNSVADKQGATGLIKLLQDEAHDVIAAAFIIAFRVF